mmetsp:Transcript_8095/g.9226  ORF Transcript_8095/g.9226 Transcript_8095/m.9226 type:complete len:105 (+) Transcript_8095:233-547(+)
MTSKEIELMRGRIYRELSFFNKATKRRPSFCTNQNEDSSTQESDSPQPFYKTFNKDHSSTLNTKLAKSFTFSKSKFSKIKKIKKADIVFITSAIKVKKNSSEEL